MFKKSGNDRNVAKIDNIEMKILRTTNDKYELDTIRSLLDKHDIPYILKEKGIGGYMKIISGASMYGTDVMVESSQLERSKSIIDKFLLNG